MAQEITIDINVVTNAAPAASKISKELDGIKKQAKEVKDGLDEALNAPSKGDGKIKQGAADVQTLRNALAPVKGLINDLTGGMSDAFFQAFQSVKATTAGIKGLDLALKTATFGIAILVIQEAIKLYDQLVVSEEEEAAALKAATDAKKAYNDATIATADALDKENKARAGGSNELKREVAQLEAAGATAEEIFKKKKELNFQEKLELLQRQAFLGDDAQAQKDIAQSILDNESALNVLRLSEEKRIKDLRTANAIKSKAEREKEAQENFDRLNREQQAIILQRNAVEDAAEARRVARLAKEKQDRIDINQFNVDADTEAFNAEIALQEKRKQLGEKRVADEKAIQDAISFAQSANLANVQNTIGALGSLFEEGTAASKAAAIAQIAIGTGVGFVNGLDIAQKSAKATGPAAAFAFPLFYAAQVAAVLAAAGQAKKILTTVKGGGSVSTPTAPSVGGTPSSPSAPQFNIVGQGGTNQLAQSIGGQFDQPIRAYVVGQDVTTSQQLQRQRVRTATFG